MPLGSPFHPQQGGGIAGPMATGAPAPGGGDAFSQVLAAGSAGPDEGGGGLATEDVSDAVAPFALESGVSGGAIWQPTLLPLALDAGLPDAAVATGHSGEIVINDKGLPGVPGGRETADLVKLAGAGHQAVAGQAGQSQGPDAGEKAKGLSIAPPGLSADQPKAEPALAADRRGQAGQGLPGRAAPVSRVEGADSFLPLAGIPLDQSLPPSAVPSAVSTAAPSAVPTAAPSAVPSAAPSIPEGGAGAAHLEAASAPVQPEGAPARADSGNPNDNALPPTAAAIKFADPQLSTAENIWRQHWVGGAEAEEGTAQTPAVIPGATGDDGQKTPGLPVLPDASLLSPVAKDFAAKAEGSPNPNLRSVATGHAAHTPPPFAVRPPPAATATTTAADPAGRPFAELAPSEGSFAVPFGQLVSTQAQAQAAPTPVAMPANVTPTIIALARAGDDGPTQIALSPEELGRLTISVRHEGDFVHVTLTAERPETLDLLRRHSGDLLADLRQSGFSGATFSFGQNGQDQKAGTSNAPLAVPGHAPVLAPLPAPDHPTPARAHAGAGLDLRL